MAGMMRRAGRTVRRVGLVLVALGCNAFGSIALGCIALGCNAIGGIEDGDDGLVGVGGTQALPTAEGSGGGREGGMGLVGGGGRSGMGGGPPGNGGTNVPDGGGDDIVPPCGAEGQACCSESEACQGRLSCAADSQTCVLCGSFAGLVAPAPYTSSSGGGVSADGLVVVGSLSVDTSYRAFRWSAMPGAFTLYLDDAVDSEASAVNSDGTVVTANIEPGSPFRWTLGALEPVALPQGAVPPARVGDVSGDGNVMVGYWTTTAGESRAWRWQDGVAEDLGFLLGAGGRGARVSADGLVIVGDTQGGANSQAFRFTWDPTLAPSAKGRLENLGALAGDSTSFARGVSADGGVVVGTSTLGSRNTAVRWDYPAGTPTGLPPLSAGGFSQAFDVSEDGRIVVGIAQDSSAYTAVLWDETGVHSIQQALADRSVTIPESWSFESANNVSADGRVIVGDGRNPAGMAAVWVAVLAPNCRSP
jgi:probable HAF family extracellular repeat protein